MNRVKRLPKWACLLVLGMFLSGAGANRFLWAQSIGSVGARPLAVQEVSFYSPAVEREMHFEIVLPQDYENSGKRYPVIYLLHGLTSNYKAWARMGVPVYLNQFDMIAVIPDAGNSWYVNWSESAAGQKNNFDDYIAGDLINYVDGHYRTIARREGRAIIGLSMGGYGGITLGLRHPELFCAIGSHSGALSWAQQARQALQAGREPFVTWTNRQDNPGAGGLNIKGFSTQAERTPQGKIFLKPEDADAYDPFKLVLQIPADKLPHIYLDCGTEDGLIKSALEFTQLLTDNKIPFTYAQSPGGHAPTYWLREVELSMSVQYAVIRRHLRRITPAADKPVAFPEEFKQDVFRTAGGNLQIVFVGHGTLAFAWQGKVIHVDPVGGEADYRKMPKADLILVTHEHGDHLDPKAIESIRTADTQIILTKTCVPRVPGGQVMTNGQVLTVQGFNLEATPAYNIKNMRSPDNPYHPKGLGNGYLITFGDKRVYVAGDTENIPEMQDLKDIDIAFLPMNLPFTMTPEMTAAAAQVIQPKVLYPYHFGDTDTNELIKLLQNVKNIEVRIRDMK